MNKFIVKKNSINISIILFLVIFLIFTYLRPNFLFLKDGSIRMFGIGKSNTTILPLWLLVIICAIFSYLFVLSFFL